MTAIFYDILICLFVGELFYLFSDTKGIARLFIAYNYRKRNFLNKKLQAILAIQYINMVIKILFLVIGLFTFQGEFFLLYLLIEHVLGKYIGTPALKKNAVQYNAWIKYNTVIEIMFLGFLILNHYFWYINFI